MQLVELFERRFNVSKTLSFNFMVGLQRELWNVLRWRQRTRSIVNGSVPFGRTLHAVSRLSFELQVLGGPFFAWMTRRSLVL